MKGVVAIRSSASFQLETSMTPAAISMNTTLQKISTQDQAMVSESLWASLVSRDMI